MIVIICQVISFHAFTPTALARFSSPICLCYIVVSRYLLKKLAVTSLKHQFLTCAIFVSESYIVEMKTVFVLPDNPGHKLRDKSITKENPFPIYQ